MRKSLLKCPPVENMTIGKGEQADQFLLGAVMEIAQDEKEIISIMVR